MNTHLSGRTVCLLLAGCILAGSIQSAPVSGLTIERLEGSSVFLTWTNDGPDYVLQELNPLTESGRWQTVPEPRQLLKGQLGVTLSVQNQPAHSLRKRRAGRLGRWWGNHQSRLDRRHYRAAHPQRPGLLHLLGDKPVPPKHEDVLQARSKELNVPKSTLMQILLEIEKREALLRREVAARLAAQTRA